MKANKKSSSTVELVCKECKKNFLVYKSTLKTRSYTYCSKKCYEINRTYLSGNSNPLWKGSDVGYYALHSWVRRVKGSPQKCSKCGKTGGKIEWANIDHRYDRNPDDYISLCTSCHREYDFKEIFLKVKKNCLVCEKEYWVSKQNEQIAKFCSMKCRSRNRYLKSKEL